MLPAIYIAGGEEAFIYVPSLEHVAAVRTATILWNSSKIRTLINTMCVCGWDDMELRKTWQCIEDHVRENVLGIFLPELVKQRVLDYVKPIGVEILKWKIVHDDQPSEFFGCHLTLPSEFCWTLLGRIRKKKTAAMMVKDHGLDIIMRCELACLYCLESDIKDLWTEYETKSLNAYGVHHCKYHATERVSWRQNILFWTSIMYGKDAAGIDIIKAVHSNGISDYCLKCLFFIAAERGHTAAVQYFLKTLPILKSEILLVKCLELILQKTKTSVYGCEPYRGEVIFFLLSKLRKEQKKRILKKYPSVVLQLFLEWPRQDFFMKIAKLLVDCLFDDDYDHVLKCIAFKAMDGYKDYRNLFTEFWKLGSDTHKRHVLHLCTLEPTILKDLFVIGDKRNIMLMMSDAPLKEQDNIISRCRTEAVDNEFKLLWTHLTVFLIVVVMQNKKKM